MERGGDSVLGVRGASEGGRVVDETSGAVWWDSGGEDCAGSERESLFRRDAEMDSRVGREESESEGAVTVESERDWSELA